MNNKPYLLALNRIKQIGPRSIKKFLKTWPRLEDMFHLSAIDLQRAGVPAKLADAIASFDFMQIEADLHWEEKEHHHLLTWDDRRYPSLLNEIYDPPPVLYALGDLSCLNQFAIAMVGSRNPSINGKENAWRFAYDLARSNLTIISGLALGVDAQAHMGCLKAGGRTIGVMATGIDSIYPVRHKKLAEEIAKKGLLLTEFPLGTPPIAGHFPRRNRIISGLSLATLVVEAAIKSGSLITAQQALDQNREVLAIPGSIHNPLARGCHHLLQQGAKLVTSSEDILSELKFMAKASIQEKTHTAIMADESSLVKCIGFEVTTVDQIIERSGLSMTEVTCDLAELELQGIVKAVPGGYMRCSV